jgi:spermidine/putrescine transport system substrate-binding protein
MRDTVGLIMQQQGVDITGKFTKDQVAKAMDEVTKRVADGNIRRIKGNAYMEDLKSGNAIAGIVWSGDLFILRAETENENWEFVIPDSGGTLWSDNMMIPITSTHRRNAMAHGLLLPARRRGAGGGIRQLRLPRGRRAGGDEEDRSRTGREPVHLPVRKWIKEHKVQGFRALDAQEDADYSAMWAKVVGN